MPRPPPVISSTFDTGELYVPAMERLSLRTPDATFHSQAPVKRGVMETTWPLAFLSLFVLLSFSSGDAVSQLQAQAVRIARIEHDLRAIDERGEDTPRPHSIAERMKTL